MTIDPVPPDHLIELVGGGGAEGYRAVGKNCFDLFVNYGGLRPGDRVLEVGCGCGRAAMPLTRYLTTGSYEGFDIVLQSIEWCQQNITPRWLSFRFQHADVFNYFYNPEGEIQGKDFRFPYPDNSFDFTFLTSVFTHMLTDDVAQYTREISRTLKPNGTAMITFFILNEESQRLQLTPESTNNFLHRSADGQAFVTDPARPEAVVAYLEDDAIRLLTDNGLLLREPIYFGAWCGRTGAVSGQDLAICQKA